MLACKLPAISVKFIPIPSGQRRRGPIFIKLKWYVKWSSFATVLMFCRKQQSWVNVLSSLQDCDMKSVQSNTSVAIVGKWIAHNRHNTHINIDINIGTICDTRLNMRHNFQKPPFSTVHTTTWKCRFQIYPLWRAFSKSDIFLEKNATSV